MAGQDWAGVAAGIAHVNWGLWLVYMCGWRWSARPRTLATSQHKDSGAVNSFEHFFLCVVCEGASCRPHGLVVGAEDWRWWWRCAITETRLCLTLHVSSTSVACTLLGGPPCMQEDEEREFLAQGLVGALDPAAPLEPPLDEAMGQLHWRLQGFHAQVGGVCGEGCD